MDRRGACGSILAFSLVLALVAVPPKGFAQSGKGVELYEMGRFKEAEGVFRDALKKSPADVPDRYYLGLSILLQDRFGEALDIFLKVKHSQDKADKHTHPAFPDNYQINLAMGRARLGLNQYAEAWKNLEAARVEHKDSADVYVYRGVYYYQQDKFHEALKELAKAVSLDAKNAYAYYFEGLTYYKNGQAAEAVNALKMFLQLYPDAPEAEKAKEIVNKLC